MMIRNLTLALVVFVAGMTSSTQTQAQPYGGGELDCTSRNYSYQRCPVPWGDARIVRQTSDSQCVRGRSWGFDRRGGFVWVDKGCGGRFVAAGGGGPGPGHGGGGWRPGPDWDRRFSFTCESNDSRYNFCAIDVGGAGRVSLERQTSNSPCIEGRTWGWNRAGVWIQGGCRGIFTIDRRWR